MSCLANTIFKEKMQNLFWVHWDSILKKKDEWERFCRNKSEVTGFIEKSMTVIDIDCLIQKLGGFDPAILEQNVYKELSEVWEKTKRSLKFF